MSSSMLAMRHETLVAVCIFPQKTTPSFFYASCFITAIPSENIELLRAVAHLLFNSLYVPLITAIPIFFSQATLFKWIARQIPFAILRRKKEDSEDLILSSVA